MKHQLPALLLLLSASLASAQAPAGNVYFWPAFHDEIQFKAKSHAIRGTITMTSAATKTIDGKSYRQVTLASSPGRLPGIEKSVLIRADDSGLYMRFDTAPGTPEVLALALPATAGKQWQTVDRFGKPSLRHIDSVGQCDIKGQVFEQCVRVSFETDGGKAVAYYAPHYGEIINSRKNGFLRRTIHMGNP